MSAAVLYDAIIIGGGPGGSSAATFLAKAGKRVLVLEKEVFPRFHIGESLLPYNFEIFREMGVMPKLQAAGLMKKHGAQFLIGNASKSLALTFRNGKFTKETMAYQVERAVFDQLLLNHSKECCAEVREGWTVGKFEAKDDEISIEATSPKQEKQTFRAKYLIDASGRANLTGNQEGLRNFHPRLRKLSIFGHFNGVKLDEGEKAGDTVIIRLADKWFWIIPLSHEKVSVGLVMDKDDFTASHKPAEQLFNEVWQSSAVLRERMKDAKLIGNIKTTSDFSYRNSRLTSKRLFRVGDAAGFMDPIFSSGVFIAMHSGKVAANSVLQLLERPQDVNQVVERYEKNVNRAMNFYWEMVEGFYTTPFMELFMSPRNKWDLPSAVVAVLAGELEGGWKMAWRMRLFFLLVKAQKKWPLVPRLRFD